MTMLSREEFESLIEGVTNWGRWGSDDEVGACNYITQDVRRRAAECIRTGRVFSLALPFDESGPQSVVPGRFNPIHLMIKAGGDLAGAVEEWGGFDYADDTVFMPLQCGTQWDGLSHVFHNGSMYNGFSSALVMGSGAKRNGIERLAGTVATRGVLLDVTRACGIDPLPAGYSIGPDDLIRSAAGQGVEIYAGDILLVRTGWLRECRTTRSGDWASYALGASPGLSYASVAWLHDKQVAGVATDTYRAEVYPGEVEGVRSPFHILAIVYCGLLVGEIFNMEELAEDCASDSQYEFLFVAPPLPVTGAVGSPINPYAIK
jgi:kynurenine formamidase